MKTFSRRQAAIDDIASYNQIKIVFNFMKRARRPDVPTSPIDVIPNLFALFCP